MGGKEKKKPEKGEIDKINSNSNRMSSGPSEPNRKKPVNDIDKTKNKKTAVETEMRNDKNTPESNKPTNEGIQKKKELSDDQAMVKKCENAIRKSLKKINYSKDKTDYDVEEYLEILSSKIDDYCGAEAKKQCEKKCLLAEDKIVLEIIDLYENYRKIMNSLSTTEMNVTDAMSEIGNNIEKLLKNTNTTKVESNVVGKPIDYEHMDIIHIVEDDANPPDTVLRAITVGYYIRHDEVICEQKIIASKGGKNVD